MKSKKKVKGLVLFSGGLDSSLAAKLLVEQGIKVSGLIFQSFFWNVKQAEKAAKKLGIEYKIINFAKKHLKTVKNPSYGYGKAANPCLDCHILMLKETKEIMKAKGYSFVATGEVLGERPFSQNKKALELIAKESGLKNHLVRPLSARLLSPTLPEKKNWLDRKKLLAIQGRSRKIQLSLAKKYKLDFPQPAGGCILTEKEFAKKLLDLFSHWPDCTGDDVKLLFLGRHFWAPTSRHPLGAGTRTKDAPGVSIQTPLECQKAAKIVLGKNQQENEKLENSARKGDFLIKPANFPGPTALIRGENIDKKTLKKAKKLLLKHSKKLPSSKPSFNHLAI